MTRPGNEPRSPGRLANTLTARPMPGTYVNTLMKFNPMCFSGETITNLLYERAEIQLCV